MNDCIFCKIIKGEIPSKTIQEDDLVKVIMNINPEQNGDLLILNKRHIKDYSELNEEEIIHTNKIIKDLKKQIEDKLGATGVQIISNSGSIQEIKHCHVHITPDYEEKQPIVDIDIIFDKLK